MQHSQEMENWTYQLHCHSMTFKYQLYDLLDTRQQFFFPSFNIFSFSLQGFSYNIARSLIISLLGNINKSMMVY